MKDSTKNILDDLFLRYPDIQSCRASVFSSFSLLYFAFVQGNKLLICGNGGSAADASHIVGELMKGFRFPRKISPVLKEKFFVEYGDKCASFYFQNLELGFPVISLVDEAPLNFAYINDKCADLVFGNQVLNLSKPGDVLLSISTSGNSANVLEATKIAKTLGLKTILLSGKTGGIISKYADVSILVPETETFKIQERHLPIYHALCLSLENEFFGDK